MANHTPAETTEWVTRNLRSAEHVSKVEVLSDQVVRVSRVKYAPYIAGIVSVECVKADTIRPLVESVIRVEIIANVPKESYWTGETLRLAQGEDIATGGYGDLLRVIDGENVRDFQPQETVFVERGLRQHTRISSFARIHDRLYQISRNNGLPKLEVAMLNEYVLTADHLRTARDRYGQFSVAVITNPNGKPTRSAEEVARNLGVEILNWGPFFGRLNKK